MEIKMLRRATLFAAIASAFALAACSSHDSPTSSRTATMSGSVVMGESPQSMIRTESAIGLANVTIRVESSGASTQTDAAGNFTLTGVPGGNVVLDFDRADIHARGNVQVSAGSSMAVTVSIVGSHATIVPGGHVGAEIEGRVQTVGATSLTVADNRLGTVTITTTGTTSIRHGAVVLTLAQITMGMEVHVKATLQGDGTYLATEILVQDLNIGGSQEVNGTVTSIGSNTFTVQSPQGPVIIDTNDATIFTKNGMAAKFSDLATGLQVEIKGTLQNDGSVLAQLVSING
jgi:hypothetical protein